MICNRPLDKEVAIVRNQVGAPGGNCDGALCGSVQGTTAVSEGLQCAIQRSALDYGAALQLHSSAIAGDIPSGVVDRNARNFEDAAPGGFEHTLVGDPAPCVQEKRLAGHVGVYSAASLVQKG